MYEINRNFINQKICYCFQPLSYFSLFRVSENPHIPGREGEGEERGSDESGGEAPADGGVLEAVGGEESGGEKAEEKGGGRGQGHDGGPRVPQEFARVCYSCSVKSQMAHIS